ncbi:hypothetical protein B0H13DRAFT_2084180, partial [Mycena leptocephala]
MISTDDPYEIGTATFTGKHANSLEEVEASLNDLDDEIDDTQNTVSQWSSSYTGSPSF